MVVWLHESKRKTSFQYAAIIAAIVLVSQLSVHDLSLKKLAVTAYQNLASVASLSAAVQPNEYNVLATELEQKNIELTTREQDLIKREQALGEQYQREIDANKRLTLYVLGGVTAFLLLMIFLNFYFDVKREEERERTANTMGSGNTPTRL